MNPGAQDKQVTTSLKDDLDLPFDSITPKNVPHLEQTLMSLPEFTPDKRTLLQKQVSFYNNILTHLHCNEHDKYFTDFMGILHKKVNFNSMFSSIVLPKNPLNIYYMHPMTH